MTKIIVVRNPCVENGNGFPPKPNDYFRYEGRDWRVKEVTHKTSLKTGELCRIITLIRPG